MPLVSPAAACGARLPKVLAGPQGPKAPAGPAAVDRVQQGDLQDPVGGLLQAVEGVPFVAAVDAEGPLLLPPSRLLNINIASRVADPARVKKFGSGLTKHGSESIKSGS